MAKILFEEEQKFRSNWMWVIALAVPAVMLFVIIYQSLSGKMVGPNPVSNTSLAILIIIYVVPALLSLLFIKLTTIIDEEKISYGWNMPTRELNELYFSEIREWSVIQYKFVGYGYRLSRSYGTIHNATGNKGLQIIKQNGKKILIGTNKAEALKKVIEKIHLTGQV